MKQQPTPPRHVCGRLCGCVVHQVNKLIDDKSGKKGKDGVTPQFQVTLTGMLQVNYPPKKTWVDLYQLPIIDDLPKLQALQMMLGNMSSTPIRTLAYNDVVPFDTTVPTTQTAITYDDGVFTVDKDGIYDIKWRVVFAGGASSSSPIIFGIVLNGYQVPSMTSNADQTLSGFASVELKAGDTFKLVNETPTNVLLAANQEQATISIVFLA